MTRTSEPIFNVPGIVLAIIGIACLCWWAKILLSNEEDIAFLYYFFVPAHYGKSLLPDGSFQAAPVRISGPS